MNGTPLLKEKDKPKTLSPSQWQKKCDRAMQEKYTKLYPKCEICGKPVHCMHHFFPKSVSAILRYDRGNLIPICQGCHMQHHQAGNPRIHETVKQKRGQVWYVTLERKSREILKPTIAYYKEIYHSLTT